MKKIFVILFFLCQNHKLFAQFDRLPVSANFEMYVPKGIANPAFTKAFTGNLDFNANVSYHYKDKHEVGLIFRRTNFKAGYNNATLVTNLKTKFFYNGYGVRYFYTYFNNAYFYTQVGAAAYYCTGFYANVTYKNAPVKNHAFNFLAFEPICNINYKASDYVDVGFQVSGTMLGNTFNPTLAHLDEATKIDFSTVRTSNAKTAFISFGFNLKWYLQFEKSE